MSRPKGKPKTGGRQKGTPNRVTASVKSWLSDLIDRNRQQLEDDLQSLEPKDRLQMLEKLMQYVVPRQSTAKIDIDLNTLTDEQLNTLIEQITEGESDD